MAVNAHVCLIKIMAFDTSFHRENTVKSLTMKSGFGRSKSYSYNNTVAFSSMAFQIELLRMYYLHAVHLPLHSTD